MNKRILSVLALMLTILFTSCSQYEKVLKSNDVNLKLTEAIKYYDAKRYSKANPLLESLMPLLKGTKSFEGLYYRYAYSFYYMKDYLSASYHFKNFTDFFPNSTSAEEMEFMHASTLYKMSPDYELEQTNTQKAIGALQTFNVMHPNSKYKAEALKIIEDGLKKLEKKDAEAAKLYYNIGQFKAATVAYANVIREYPDSDKSDFYHFMIVKAMSKYAMKSVESKQAERFALVISEYNKLKAEYPSSAYLKEAELLSSVADQKLKTLNK